MRTKYVEMKLLILCFLLLIYCFSSSYAQIKDSLIWQDSFPTLVVTATRSEAVMADLPLPIAVVDKKEIQAIGSLRLNEVLREQTGLFIQAEHGQGLQMQGFDADYTLILIDGEPLVGRTAGTLELSRVALGNIEKIEILKGASSSLYGSEALAGVVNIITDKVRRSGGGFSLRYGSNRTLDLGAQGSWKRKKFWLSGFGNFYQTGGYDLSPESYGQTVAPFANGTAQLKMGYDFSSRWTWRASGRGFYEAQKAAYDIGLAAAPVYIAGNGVVSDWNINSTLAYDFDKKYGGQIRFYQSRYSAQSGLHYEDGGQLYDSSYFAQNFLRLEGQGNYTVTKNHKIVAGLGRLWESVQATRYEGKKQFSTNYIFAQYEGLYQEKLNWILGARFDQHSVYGSQISPKLAVGYKINSRFSLRASAGWGFKAPDFRQLYLNFNNAVAGYAVYGSEELPLILQQLQASNQLAAVFINPDSIGKLKAESSIGYNIGANININKNSSAQVNFFRNDVKNLIETQTAARLRNGQAVFSYYNLNRIFTQGAEVNFSYHFAKYFQAKAGYQLLYAQDKEMVEQIKAGLIFRRDAQTLQTTRVKMSDYGGLFNRSRHSYNLKISYDNPKIGFSANARAIYRGQYGFADSNANSILDDKSEYVNGYFTLHFSASQLFCQNKIRLQIGIDNALNQQNPTQIPNLAGRLIWLSIQFSF